VPLVCQKEFIEYLSDLLKNSDIILFPPNFYDKMEENDPLLFRIFFTKFAQKIFRIS
jgi:hypothetical protein